MDTSSIIVFIIILLIFSSFVGANRENFNARDNIVMPLGYPEYGLRGERWRVRPIDDCYYDHYNCYEKYNTYNPYFPAYAVDGCNCGFFNYKGTKPPSSIA
jgi:hypothetical protein